MKTVLAATTKDSSLTSNRIRCPVLGSYQSLPPPGLIRSNLQMASFVRPRIKLGKDVISRSAFICHGMTEPFSFRLKCLSPKFHLLPSLFSQSVHTSSSILTNNISFCIEAVIICCQLFFFSSIIFVLENFVIYIH